MSKNARFNVEFSFETPMEYDSIGRRLSPSIIVGKYIEDFFYNLALTCSCNTTLFNRGRDEKIYEDMANKYNHHKILKSNEELLHQFTSMD